MEKFFKHPTAIVDEHVKIGKGTKIWHFSHIMPNTSIGQNCNLGQNVVVGPDVQIGNGCKIQNNISVYKGVTLEDNVFCGPSMVFTNVFNPRASVKRMDELRHTLVKKGASLGANCTIVCGITIGKYAFVGAGSVVTKDVPDYALMVGNPARQTGWMCKCGEKLDQEMNCPVCSKTISEKSEQMPFIDLAAQQKRILPQIEKNIQTVLKHGKYIMGPEINLLENKLAEFTSTRHAITCSSGTDALLMALMAYEIGPGDAVFTTPFTFIATAEVIKLLGATPVFVDIEPDTYNLSVKNLKTSIKEILKTSQLEPKAIIPVDLFGLPCDYDQINKVASEYNLIVIEDAAQSFGAEYKDKKAGSFGHAACTSFFPAKPLGCYGDGGAIFTNSNNIAEKLKSIRIHGQGEKDKYDNVRIGLNGRFDTLQAAILLPKLKILPQEIDARQKAAQTYTDLLASSSASLTLPTIPDQYKSAWAQYSILAPNKETRKSIQNALKEKHIPTAIYYPTPLHLQTAFDDLNYNKEDFPVSEDYSNRIFSIPMHPYLTKEQQSEICNIIKSQTAILIMAFNTGHIT